jgi:hypothetical protein
VVVEFEGMCLFDLVEFFLETRHLCLVLSPIEAQLQLILFLGFVGLDFLFGKLAFDGLELILIVVDLRAMLFDDARELVLDFSNFQFLQLDLLGLEHHVLTLDIALSHVELSVLPEGLQFIAALVGFFLYLPKSVPQLPHFSQSFFLGPLFLIELASNLLEILYEVHLFDVFILDGLLELPDLLLQLLLADGRRLGGRMQSLQFLFEGTDFGHQLLTGLGTYF